MWLMDDGGSIEVREYVDESDRSPFGRWFYDLNREAFRKVESALNRIEERNMSNIVGVGDGVMECRINFGPGYRIYFGWDGSTLVILLGGGTKSRQQQDISVAKKRWTQYKRLKQQEVLVSRRRRSDATYTELQGDGEGSNSE